jgi:predicted ArsR family transcriptional regulator
MVVRTARQRVLAFIGHRNPVTTAQIGQALGMSAPTVRHHLAILVADGRISLEEHEGHGKRGRPEKWYRLSDRVAGENLAMLSEILLSAWLAEVTDTNHEAAMRTLAQKLAERIGAMDAGLPAPKRVVQLTERLNALHYQARWEAGAEGPRILFGHCPYAAVIEAHPELCSMDTALLSGELRAEMEQLAKIERKPGGASQCIFAVRARSARAGG